MDICTMHADDMLKMYKQYGSFNNCAYNAGVDRKTWAKYWAKKGLPNPKTVEKVPLDEINKIMACGDLHLGSKQQQVTHFLDYVEQGINIGITNMVMVGDIIEGLMPREGHPQIRFLHSIDNIYDYTCDIFSAFADELDKIYVIMGNHDESLNRRKDGFNICEHLAEDFSSVVYVDDPNGMCRPVDLSGGAKAILYHGSGGCGKNLVTRTRNKTIDFANAHDEWDFLFAGHCHRFSSDLWIGKHSFSLGCFQGRTHFLAQKGLTPQIRGEILTYTIKKGRIKDVINIPIEYENVIDHDY